VIAIDTDEKLDWLLNALENNEIQLVSSRLTKEDKEEISRELAELKATRGKSPASEKEWEEFSKELAELRAARQETCAKEAVLA